MTTDPPSTIDIDRCLAVDVWVGTVMSAEAFPQAKKPAFQLTIDRRPAIGIKRSSAQMTRHYAPVSLIGRQVVAVVNLPPRQIGPVRSEVLVLGVHEADRATVLAVPDRPVPNGSRLY